MQIPMNRLTNRLSIPLCLLLLCPVVFGQNTKDASAPRKSNIPARIRRAIIREGKDRSQVMPILDHLTNRIGPRLTSSDNLTNACEWARDYLIDAGLVAKLEKWGEYPVGFNRGPCFG